jgi:8-oxo-dGTP diphosphatase
MPMENQGIDNQRYRVIPRTLIFLINKCDQVLLLKGSQSKRLWSGLFNGIGGHIEKGEDILQAACRELHEETGLEGVDLHLCGQVMVDGPEQTGIALFVYKGICAADVGTLINSIEGELHWFDLTELNEIPLVEDLRVLLPKIVQYQVGDPIIVARSIYSKDGKLQVLFS